MEFNLSTFSTSDLISSINIIATITFSYLVWRATVASNKTAIAIKEASEKEKREINNQNRFIIYYNLLKIKDTLFTHTFEDGFKESFIMDIENILHLIRNFDLTSFFIAKEIKEIFIFIEYMDNNFLKEAKKQRVYDLTINPTSQKLEFNYELNNSEYVLLEKELIKDALKKVNELLFLLNE